MPRENVEKLDHFSSDLVRKEFKFYRNVCTCKLEIVNLQDSTGATYSPYGYDIEGATKKNTIYPSLDPAVFEVRYPNNDINGRVVSYY